MPRVLILLTLFLVTPFLAACNGATESARQSIAKDGDKGFNYATIKRGLHNRKYAYFIPLNYNPATRYPVIIFLHGQGEGAGLGPGDGKQLTVGLAPFVEQQKHSFPFICIFPQSDGNWNANSQYARDVIAALDDVASKYSIDPNRVSLTGLSTGGYGCYAIAAEHPGRFAAIAPMGTNTSAIAFADKLLHIPVRAYCSETGDMLAGTHDRDVVNKINVLGGQAIFIQTPTDGHNCWEHVYGSGELFNWLRGQYRRTATGIRLKPYR